MSSQIALGELQEHFLHVSDALLQGRLIPFLGAGVNLCDRPPNTVWDPIQKRYLPAGRELAEHLANEFHYPGNRVCPRGVDCPMQMKQDLDLPRVAQHAVMVRDGGPLNDAIRNCLNGDYSPTVVHRFLASIAGHPAPRPAQNWLYPLIITTNYDDLMEQAFDECHQVYDLVYYRPDDRPRATFWHQPPRKPPLRIASGTDYSYAFCQSRPTVLKIHGTVDRTNKEGGAFVITEDQYFEYLAQQPVNRLLPSSLLARLRANHLWLLGYSLQDMDFRVFLHKLKTFKPTENYRSWAVLLNSNDDQRKFWFTKGIEIVDATLSVYIAALRETLAGANFP